MIIHFIFVVYITRTKFAEKIGKLYIKEKLVVIVSHNIIPIHYHANHDVSTTETVTSSQLLY